MRGKSSVTPVALVQQFNVFATVHIHVVLFVHGLVFGRGELKSTGLTDEAYAEVPPQHVMRSEKAGTQNALPRGGVGKAGRLCAGPARRPNLLPLGVRVPRFPAAQARAAREHQVAPGVHQGLIVVLRDALPLPLRQIFVRLKVGVVEIVVLSFGLGREGHDKYRVSERGRFACE